MQLVNEKLIALSDLLVLAGALNWLSIGLFNVNFVQNLLKKNAKYVFIAVGTGGAYLLFLKLIELFHLYKDRIHMPVMMANN